MFLYLDYAISVDAIRDELPRILATTPLWDKNVLNVALTDATKHGVVEIRILVSSRNSSELFDLRCLVREKLLAFVQTNYPDALPRTRVAFSPAELEVQPGASGSAPRREPAGVA